MIPNSTLNTLAVTAAAARSQLVGHREQNESRDNTPVRSMFATDYRSLRVSPLSVHSTHCVEVAPKLISQSNAYSCPTVIAVQL